jgi:hypothetical protein
MAHWRMGRSSPRRLVPPCGRWSPPPDPWLQTPGTKEPARRAHSSDPVAPRCHAPQSPGDERLGDQWRDDRGGCEMPAPATVVI